PEELTRAALRRLWTADPAIRDFVGLAENAWDFTDPGAMPGFGPLEATAQVRQMVARIVDQIGHTVESSAAQAAQSLNDSKELNEDRAGDPPLRVADTAATEGQTAGPALGSQPSLQSSTADAASQHNAAESERAFVQPSRRSHGGALPQ